MKPPTTMYVILVAMLIAIAAMGTDLMLPALEIMSHDLNAPTAGSGHQIVTAFFLGMAVGGMIVGPLADRFGRKPVILVGYGAFVLGCWLSWVTTDWTVMLLARVLQGLGASAPRTATVAMVRDEYAGRTMARVMSVAMAVFIIVPIIAPALGQGVIYLGGWRATFVALAIFAVIVCAWFAVQQPETLPPEARLPLRLKPILAGLVEVMTNRITLGYTLAAGLISGAFIGYLGTAQVIFQTTFQSGDLFALYFAIAAVSLGLASLLNAALVERLGMRKLNWIAMIVLTVVSLVFWAILPGFAGVPPLELFFAWILISFFCVGITFGNMTALALEPMGHIAGLASAFSGSIALFISLPLADIIGQRFDGTVVPLVAGFAVLTALACLVSAWADRFRFSRDAAT